MNALTQRPFRSDTGRQPHQRAGHQAGGAKVQRVPVPTTTLLAGALRRVDWSDAYAVPVPAGSRGDPQAWADAVFHSPPFWIRVLFGVRELAVRLVGIDKGTADVFDTIARTEDEVLLGTDQRHLGFRASVLVEPDRVVVSTLVRLHNRRGRAYSALVRKVHPLVVSGMLAQAARKLAP